MKDWSVSVWVGVCDAGLYVHICSVCVGACCALGGLNTHISLWMFKIITGSWLGAEQNESVTLGNCIFIYCARSLPASLHVKVPYALCPCVCVCVCSRMCFSVYVISLLLLLMCFLCNICALLMGTWPCATHQNISNKHDTIHLQQM